MAALGAASGDPGLAIFSGIFGFVVGFIAGIPLKRRSGELYADGEVARGIGLFFASVGVVFFVILVAATVAKAT